MPVVSDLEAQMKGLGLKPATEPSKSNTAPTVRRETKDHIGQDDFTFLMVSCYDRDAAALWRT